MVELDQVLHMPSLGHAGIVSVDRSTILGCKFSFDHPEAESHMIYKNKFTVPFRRSNHLYYVNAVGHQSRPPLKRRTYQQWHEILGHLHYDAVIQMPRLVEGMAMINKKYSSCETCLLNKTRKRYSRLPDERATKAFQFIHSDIHQPEPLNVEDQHSDYKYVVGFVDDYSGYICVYPMKSKGDVPEAFQEFLTFARSYGDVQRIRTDNAQEFLSAQFEDICKKNKIRHERSIPYTPHQNGTAERAWGTLKMRARCMINSSKMGHKMWPYAYSYGAYVYNRSYVRRIQATPYQLVFNKKPNIAKLARFGSIMFAHKDHTECNMEQTAQKGNFVGFCPKTGGHEFYDPEDGTVTAKAHVYFPDERATSPVISQTARNDQVDGEDSAARGSGSQGTATAVGNNLQIRDGTADSHGPRRDRGSSPPGRVAPSHDERWEDRAGQSGRGSSYAPSNSDADMESNNDFDMDYETNTPVRGKSCEPRASKRVKTKPIKFKDYVDLEEADINFLNFKDLDINHVRFNPVRLYNVNSYKNTSRDHRFNVAALRYVYNVHKVPKTYRQALASPDWKIWEAAINEEIEKLKVQGTGELVDRDSLEPGTKVLTARWVFSWKVGPNGEIQAKARYCGRGFMQDYGVDYLDTYAPMSRMTSIRCLMQLTAQYNFIGHQIDVTSAYLNAKIDHEIYMEQPDSPDKDPSKVWRLKKSIYGLKQSARLWNVTLHTFLEKLGYKRNSADMCLYRRCDKRGIIFLLIWVDDIVILSDKRELVDEFVKQMSDEYKIKDLGPLKFFLGIEFEQSENSVKMSQSGYCKTVLERFGMDNCNTSKTPCVPNIHDELRANLKSPKLDKKETTRYRELVGSLIYLEQITRPDISFIVNILGQQMHQPTKAHWNIGLKVLRYLKGTQDYSLNYHRSDRLELTVFGDADWANGVDRKSQSGYCAFLSDNSSPISWSSRKQKLVSTSTTNAEYVALAGATCEALWLQKLLWDFQIEEIVDFPARMLSDNTGALALAYTPQHSDRSKHIDVKFHFVRDYVEHGLVTLEHVRSNQNLADGFTKSLNTTLFGNFGTLMSRKINNKHIIRTTSHIPFE